MDINHLKEFVVLAQTSNFLDAADILYSSQSTLSKHIKNMEAELGAPLFDRTTRKVSVSKYGRLFLPYARKITEIHDKYIATLKSGLETDLEVLNLGSIYGLAQYNITDVLVSFKKNRPQSTFNVIQGSSKDLTEMLRQRKFDLAFIRDIEDPKDEFVKIPFVDDTIVAVLPVTHLLARRKKIPLRLLSEENFLLEVPGTMPYRLSVKACELSGFEPKITYTHQDRDYLIGLVGKKMGVALMLKKLVMHMTYLNISLVDITPNLKTQISLCYPKAIKLSTAAEHFLSCVETH